MDLVYFVHESNGGGFLVFFESKDNGLLVVTYPFGLLLYMPKITYLDLFLHRFHLVVMLLQVVLR